MRIRRVLSTAALLAGVVAAPALLVAAASPALADASPSASPSGDGSAPTEAGTSFRTATEIEQGVQATAGASTGDYLYWQFAADAGQRPTVKATVKLPEASKRSGTETWQIDVYDGLRRRQACQYGAQTRTAGADASSVELSCTLRTVRAWSEPWANDPLPGTYYVRLTATALGATDLGLPMSTELQVDSKDIGGSAAVDGSLAKPLVPGIAVTSAQSEDTSGDSGSKAAVLSSLRPDGSNWWSDRWVWTAIGGVLAALAGIWGYSLTRGRGRPTRIPPGA
ncbi:hypothetical protein ACFYXJ_24295 [Streptomyces sp. NPDC002667]|uniref:hypothetical protein n=1 Tax=Streptomyces sp. NPDC002667 TaxID=3364657 RepID=UPI0036B2CED9